MAMANSMNPGCNCCGPSVGPPPIIPTQGCTCGTGPSSIVVTFTVVGFGTQTVPMTWYNTPPSGPNGAGPVPSTPGYFSTYRKLIEFENPDAILSGYWSVACGIGPNGSPQTAYYLQDWQDYYNNGTQPGPIGWRWRSGGRSYRWVLGAGVTCSPWGLQGGVSQGGSLYGPVSSASATSSSGSSAGTIGGGSGMVEGDGDVVDGDGDAAYME